MKKHRLGRIERGYLFAGGGMMGFWLLLPRNPSET